MLRRSQRIGVSQNRGSHGLSGWDVLQAGACPDWHFLARAASRGLAQGSVWMDMFCKVCGGGLGMKEVWAWAGNGGTEGKLLEEELPGSGRYTSRLRGMGRDVLPDVPVRLVQQPVQLSLSNKQCRAQDALPLHNFRDPSTLLL